MGIQGQSSRVGGPTPGCKVCPALTHQLPGPQGQPAPPAGPPSPPQRSSTRSRGGPAAAGAGAGSQLRPGRPARGWPVRHTQHACHPSAGRGPGEAFPTSWWALSLCSGHAALAWACSRRMAAQKAVPLRVLRATCCRVQSSSCSSLRGRTRGRGAGGALLLSVLLQTLEAQSSGAPHARALTRPAARRC